MIGRSAGSVVVVAATVVVVAGGRVVVVAVVVGGSVVVVVEVVVVVVAAVVVGRIVEVVAGAEEGSAAGGAASPAGPHAARASAAITDTRSSRWAPIRGSLPTVVVWATHDMARSSGHPQRSTAATTARRIFASLRVRNYRLFFIGQVVSLSGSWMQGVAQAWLVLELTGSGTALGMVSSLQFLPVLLFGPLGGVIADRFDKRRVLVLTQSTASLLAVTLGLLVLFDRIELWMVYALAAGLGFVNTVDNPTRQTFVHEMVGSADLTNAVSLNSVLVNLARVIGPSLAGALIVTVGLAPCFLINSVSYLAVIVALSLMRERDLRKAPRQPRGRGRLREGFRYVRRTPAVLVPLVMMAVVGTLAYEFQVALPLLARFTFDGDAGTYGAMSALMGAGAIVGGLITAGRRRRRATTLAVVAVLFGSLQIVTSLAPTLWMAMASLTLLGAASISFIALGNATLQLAAAPEMRGRVMALWAVAFLGSTPIGGPIIGWIGENIGPRFALGFGGLAALLSGLVAYRRLAAVDAEGRSGPPTTIVAQPGGIGAS